MTVAAGLGKCSSLLVEGSGGGLVREMMAWRGRVEMLGIYMSIG